MNLAATQEFFWNAIAANVPVAGSDIEAVLVGTAKLGAVERLEIYAGMYIHRLVEALGSEYPGVKAKLGDAEFFTIAEAYMRAHPSTHPSIDQVGRAFPDYLRRHHRRSLADLAARERAESIVLDAADDTPINADALACLPADAVANAVLTPVAALALVRSTVIFRRGESVRYRNLHRAEASALKRMLASKALGDICEVFTAEPEPVSAAFAVVAGWFASGWIAGVHLSTHYSG